MNKIETYEALDQALAQCRSMAAAVGNATLATTIEDARVQSALMLKWLKILGMGEEKTSQGE